MAKEKEVTLRERVIGTVAEAVMVPMNLDEIPLTKEGLLMEVEGEQFVVKVIQKKKRVHQEDVKDLLVAGEMNTLFNVPEEEEEAEEEADPEQEQIEALQDAEVAEQAVAQ